MIKNITKKYLFFYGILFFLLILIKIDYRFINEINCCSDEFDYYSHTQTIIEDKDFDYTNQYLNQSSARFNNGVKIAPAGFIGTSILNLPFYYIGYKINTITFNKGNFNFLILFYSFGPIFYIFVSFYLLCKSLFILKKTINLHLLTICFFGTGISYYAFERYGMTHVSEVLITSLLIFYTIKFTNETNSKKLNFYAFLIPLIILIGILTRWTNYYLLFLPISLNYYFRSNKMTQNSLVKNYFFFISYIASFIIFSFLSKSVYGSFIYNPQKVYSTSNVLNNFIQLNIGFFFKIFKDFLHIFYTYEFGLIWTAPCIAMAFFISLKKLLNKKDVFFEFINIIYFLQCIAVVLIWQSTASSYGFRYLYSLIPYSIFLVVINVDKNKKFFYRSLFIFSYIGFLSYIFFETTLATQLSTIPITNSFGKELVFYTQPLYLKGVLYSIFDISAYIKLIANSFLFVFVLKVFIYLNKSELFENLIQLTGNDSYSYIFQDLTNQVQSIPFLNLFIFLILIFFIFTVTFYRIKILLSKEPN